MSGRPTVITDDVVRKLEAALQGGFSVSEACLVSGISRAAYYERKASDEVFADKMELAKKWVTIRAKKVVVQAISDANFNAAKWWLEHKSRNEFGLHASDEDESEAASQAETEPDTLKLILDSMKILASEAIANVETHEAKHDVAFEAEALTLTQPVQHLGVQNVVDSDDILADLYDD